MSAALWLLAGVIVGACAVDVFAIWRDRPRPVKDARGTWRAARRPRQGWGPR